MWRVYVACVCTACAPLGCLPLLRAAERGDVQVVLAMLEFPRPFWDQMCDQGVGILRALLPTLLSQPLLSSGSSSTLVRHIVTQPYFLGALGQGGLRTLFPPLQRSRVLVCVAEELRRRDPLRGTHTAHASSC